jgi:hypothetical protein
MNFDIEKRRHIYKSLLFHLNHVKQSTFYAHISGTEDDYLDTTL